MPKGRKAEIQAEPEAKLAPGPNGSGVVGTQNEDRLSRFNAIADSADEIRANDFGPGEDEDADEGDEHVESEATPSPDSEVEREQLADDDDPDTTQVDEAQPAPRAKKFKLKINGVEREASEEEVLALAQKVGSADQYLAEAARTYQQSKQAQQPSATDADANLEEDEVALARAIQMGSEEEAVKAIRKLRPGPSIKPDDLARLVDERLTFQQAVNKASDEFKDIFGNPFLRNAFLQEDARLIQVGDQRSYLERYRSIGNDIRQSLGGLKPNASEQLEQKLNRKSSVTPIRAASTRAVAAADEEPDDTPEAVIATMAKARGQRI